MQVRFMKVAFCVLAGFVVTDAANASGSYGGASGFTPPSTKKEAKPSQGSSKKGTEEKKTKKKSSEIGVPGAMSRIS